MHAELMDIFQENQVSWLSIWICGFNNSNVRQSTITLRYDRILRQQNAPSESLHLALRMVALKENIESNVTEKWQTGETVKSGKRPLLFAVDGDVSRSAALGTDDRVRDDRLSFLELLQLTAAHSQTKFRPHKTTNRHINTHTLGSMDTFHMNPSAAGSQRSIKRFWCLQLPQIDSKCIAELAKVCT